MRAASGSPPTPRSRPHKESGTPADGLGRPRQDTASERQKPIRHVFAHTYSTAARSGRVSLCMVVVRCPGGCGYSHRFIARQSFTTGVRTAPCGARFVLHALVEAVA
jgi:hypothetical protein